MLIHLIDPRSLGVAICQPANAKWLNWSTGAWEAPFVGQNHVRPMAPMLPAPDPHSVVQSADIGNELLSRPDVVALTYAIDQGGGVPTYTPVDLSSTPLPVPMGCLSALTRL